VGIERVKEEAFETDGAARSAGSLPSIPASIEKASAIAGPARSTVAWPCPCAKSSRCWSET